MTTGRELAGETRTLRNPQGLTGGRAAFGGVVASDAFTGPVQAAGGRLVYPVLSAGPFVVERHLGLQLHARSWLQPVACWTGLQLGQNWVSPSEPF